MTATRLTFADLTPGDRVANRFEIIDELGRGGHSVVYAAHDLSVGVKVALKVLVPSPIAARAARERLKREVQLIRSLRHPHIVGVHDYLEEGQVAMVVMDLIEGSDLARLITRRGGLPIDECLTLGSQIASALAEAHQAGILHRDIKPANILIDRAGHAWLTDFGSARLDSHPSMTQTGALPGTVSYLAPEVWNGTRGDARADLYALGVTLYEALTGKLPPRQSAHLPPTPEPHGFRPAGVRADLPPWLDQVVAMATTANPRHRFATARQLAEILSDRSYPSRPLVDATLSAVKPVNPAAPTPTIPALARVTLAGVAVAGIAAGVLAERSYLWATPLILFLLWRRTRRSLTPPIIESNYGIRRWPLERREAVSFEDLPPGPTRGQLDDILIVAQLQLDSAANAEIASQWKRSLEPIVESAIQVAADLHRVDETLLRLERGTASIRFVPTGIWDRLAKLERTRDELSTAMLEALGVLGRFRETTVDETLSAESRLRSLVEECHEEVERHISAAAELETLFQKPQYQGQSDS